MDKIGKTLALHHAMILKTCDGIVSQLEGPPLDAGKPAVKAGEIEGVLLAGIDEDYRTWFCAECHRVLPERESQGAVRALPSFAILTEMESVFGVSSRLCLTPRCSPGSIRDASRRGPAWP
jgi:hypothetical protein